MSDEQDRSGPAVGRSMLEVHSAHSTAVRVIVPLVGMLLAFAFGPSADGADQAAQPEAPSELDGRAAPQAAEPQLTWEPAPPEVDRFDWVQLKSGEWLKGRIKVYQDRDLEFDSEELDDLTFDWKDILQLRSPEAFCLFEDDSMAVGQVVVDTEYVTVSGPIEVRRPRSDLRGLSPGKPKEINYWSGKLSLGVTVKSGNTEQSELTTRATFQRRTPRTRVKLDYQANYGKLEGIENVNSQRANLNWDIFLTRRVFVRPLLSQYYRDVFVNIEHQGTVGLGAGYYVFDRPRIEWLVSGGPAYQYTRFMEVEPGEDGSSSTPAFVLQTSADAELTKRVDLILAYQSIITREEAGLWTHHTTATLEIEVTRVLDVDIYFEWDRTEKPRPAADGSVPDKDDLRLSLQLGVDF